MDENVQRAVVRALDLGNATHVGQYMLVSKAWSVFVKQAALEDIVNPYHKVTQTVTVKLLISPRHVKLKVDYPPTQRFVFGLRFHISSRHVTIHGSWGKSGFLFRSEIRHVHTCRHCSRVQIGAKRMYGGT